MVKGEKMSVIITDMTMPKVCCLCEFSQRWDNGHTICKRKPDKQPIEDGENIPEYCPLKEVKE